VNSLNFQVIKTVCEWLEQGDRVFFVTVLNTWGASPRPVGSLFAFNVDKYKQVGSLSGGCIEEDLIQFLVKQSESLPELFFLKRYGDKDGDKERYLLPCGGTLELLIETLFDNQKYQHFLDILQTLEAHKSTTRLLKFLATDYSCILKTDNSDKVAPILSFSSDQTELLHRLNPVYQLLIVGAGDVTNYVDLFAKTLDFNVTICEPRKDYSQRLTQFESNTPIHYGLPDDLIRSNFSGRNTAIICLAHDPKVDDMALMEALTNSDAFYIGAMGSLKTTENRKVRLQTLGIQEKQLSKLRAPIGLNIHSKTPQEIAISILAELISARHKLTVCC
jgi:xanthine dehydrogenase accessory factor